MTYEKAMAEVVEFENVDIITTSGDENTPSGPDHGSWPHLASYNRCLSWC